MLILVEIWPPKQKITGRVKRVPCDDTAVSVAMLCRWLLNSANVPAWKMHAMSRVGLFFLLLLKARSGTWYCGCSRLHFNSRDALRLMLCGSLPDNIKGCRTLLVAEMTSFVLGLCLNGCVTMIEAFEPEAPYCDICQQENCSIT